MRRVLLPVIGCFLTALVSLNAQEPGTTLPAGFELTDLKSSKLITPATLKGKVVVIDCWATWCPPCLVSLSHMDKWQKQFGSKLEILAVSQESPERLTQFSKNRPNSLKIISDTAGIVYSIFPYRSVPHLILIGTDGRVKAITGSENLSEAVLEKLLNNETVSLPVKKDNMSFNFDEYIASGFKVDTTLKSNFIIQPGLKNVGTMSKRHQGVFEKRRMSVINGTISLLVQLAYQTNYYRVADEYNRNIPFKDQEKFCIDNWVKEKSEAKMFENFRGGLSNNFIDMEIVKEKRKATVTVLYAGKGAEKLTACNEPLTSFDANSLSFGGSCVSTGQLADYLEEYGICGTAVVDETGLKGYYNLAFEISPGKVDGLQDELKKFGLYLKKEEREIDIVVIRKK